MFVYFLMYSSQCERRTFRYMSHVVHYVQQQYLMKQARNNMAADTAYIIFDFKQKFWARGFREYGEEKGYAMVWNGCICETNRLRFGKGCSPG